MCVEREQGIHGVEKKQKCVQKRGGNWEKSKFFLGARGNPWCLPPVVGIGMGWGREQGSLECVQKYWSQWELGLLEGWLVGVEIGVVFLVPPCLYLCIVPMYHGQSDGYVETWTSFPVTSF